MEPLILSNINRFVSLNKDEKKHLLGVFKKEKVLRKAIVQEQGRLCQRFYFVESGSLRAYHIDTAGKEFTVMFAIEDWWITDMEAFIGGKSASLSLVALENGILYSISSDAMNELLRDIPKLEKYFRVLFQRAYVREQRRALDSISLSVEERFTNFLKKYPNIIKKITQKQIASYLGVTPEFLSAVKNKSSS
nr:Crp/Fnr family transcriptional regulator [Allomuricauda sp.]